MSSLLHEGLAYLIDLKNTFLLTSHQLDMVMPELKRVTDVDMLGWYRDCLTEVSSAVKETLIQKSAVDGSAQ